MMYEQFWSLFNQLPIVVILRGYSVQQCLKIADCCRTAGYLTLEVTVNTDGVLAIVETLRKEFADMNVGAGTVLSTNDLTDVSNAGAQFIVTPVVDKAVIVGANNLNLPVFPGAFTPTEIYQAWAWGADAVKVFPANDLGPGYIKNVLAPLDDLKLIPTGGVKMENIKTYFEAGAVGVGMGGGLISRKLVVEGKYDEIAERLETFKAMLA